MKKSIFSIRTSIVFVSVLLLSSGCSSKDSKEATPATNEVATDSEITPNARVLRTSTQYLASAAKTLQLNPSEISQASSFSSLKSKLPNEGKVTEVNLNDGGIVASSKIAASACDLYLESKADSSLDEFLDELVTQAAFDPSNRNELKKLALGIIEGTSIAEPEDPAELEQAKLATCSYIVVITGLLF